MSIDINKKQAVDAIRSKYKDERYSHTFNNLYLWQNPWKLDLLLKEDMYAVRMGDPEENLWYFPVGDESRKKEFIAEQMKKGKLKFCYMSASEAEFLENNFPGKFLTERDRDRDEYVFLLTDHLVPHGKKKYELNRCWRRFSEHGPFTLRRVEKGMEHLVLSVLDQWYANSRCSEEDFQEMHILEHDAFIGPQPEDFDRWLVYAGEEPFAVLAGYPISDRIYDYCIAKENGTIKNANYGIMRLLMEELSDQYEYFNMEDDLGIEGLRKMKTLRMPVWMNEAYKASMIQE